jgi:TldD protein
MKTIAKKILDKLTGPEVKFADVRLTNTNQEQIYFQNGFLRNYNTGMDSTALGVRVLINGCWGFAGTRDLSEAGIDKAIRQAKSNALHGSRFINETVDFNPIQATVADVHYKPEIDPFKMSLDEKLGYLKNIAVKIKPQGKIVHSYCGVNFYYQEKVYANTEGTLTSQSFYNALPLMSVIASDGNQVQSRTWPGHMNGGRGGFELFRKNRFDENH